MLIKNIEEHCYAFFLLGALCQSLEQVERPGAFYERVALEKEGEVREEDVAKKRARLNFHQQRLQLLSLLLHTSTSDKTRI